MGRKGKNKKPWEKGFEKIPSSSGHLFTPVYTPAENVTNDAIRIMQTILNQLTSVVPVKIIREGQFSAIGESAEGEVIIREPINHCLKFRVMSDNFAGYITLNGVFSYSACEGIYTLSANKSLGTEVFMTDEEIRIKKEDEDTRKQASEFLNELAEL